MVLRLFSPMPQCGSRKGGTLGAWFSDPPNKELGIKSSSTNGGFMINCTGKAKLKSKVTGEIFEVDPSDLDWQCTGSEERPMGSENCYSAEIEYETSVGSHRVACTWNVWEYPSGVENMIETTPEGAELLEDFTYGLGSSSRESDED
jgi:hypothetical protein